MSEKGLKTKIFQIVPEKESLMDCYVILTEGGKLVVIDGGIDGKGKEAAPFLPSAIRAILGLSEKDPFEIDAWFITHKHQDHFYELAKMLDGYDKDPSFKIKNLYFDFPPVGHGWYSRNGERDYPQAELFEKLCRGIQKYGEINGISEFTFEKLNGRFINRESVEKGLSIIVDNCRFEILKTWDMDSELINSTSLVMKMYCKDHTVLFLGDCHKDSAAKLLKLYGGEYLHSEYVKMAHHGQNGPDKDFYLGIGADKSKRFWSTPDWVFNIYNHSWLLTDKTRGWLGLPEDPAEFIKKGLDKKEIDFISCFYPEYPESPDKVSSWTEEIIDNMTVAEF